MSWRVSRDLPVPPEVAWELVAGTRHWAAWGTTVRDVEPADAVVTTGLTGRVRTIAGPWVPFEVTEVLPGRSWSWRVAGVPATGHEVAPTADGCRVSFTVPAWAPFYLPVCRDALRRLDRLATGGR